MAQRPATTTLKSLAATLGIHVSTVSRVLNGAPDQVGKAASAEMVEKIRALAAELDYRPNLQATGLKTRQTREFGVLMPRLSDLVMATIYEGIDEAADEAGYVSFVSNTLDDPQKQRERAARALRRQVAGLIIGDSHIGDEQPLLESLAKRQLPYVLVSRRHRAHPSVSCDDEQGGRMVAQHLYEAGHRNVAVLAGEIHAATGVDRTRGFIDFYRERGIALAPHRVLHGHFDSLTGRALGDHLLGGHQAGADTKKSRPTAIFAVNDFLAIGLMGAIRDLGLQVGRDIAVVGYNDTPLAAELPIALSSVQVPMHRMGRLAVDLLLDQLAGRASRSVMLTPVLHVRASSLSPR